MAHTDTSSLGPEENGDNSEGASETSFILPKRPSLTPAQEQKLLEKVEAIESTVPVYVAILNRSNVRYDNFTTFLVSSKENKLFVAYEFLNCNYVLRLHRHAQISLVYLYLRY